jgi:hypothetical protein
MSRYVVITSCSLYIYEKIIKKRIKLKIYIFTTRRPSLLKKTLIAFNHNQTARGVYDFQNFDQINPRWPQEECAHFASCCLSFFPILKRKGSGSFSFQIISQKIKNNFTRFRFKLISFASFQHFVLLRFVPLRFLFLIHFCLPCLAQFSFQFSPSFLETKIAIIIYFLY